MLTLKDIHETLTAARADADRRADLLSIRYVVLPATGGYFVTSAVRHRELYRDRTPVYTTTR